METKKLNNTILDIDKISDNLLLDFNFEEYDTINKIDIVKSVMNKLERKVNKYYHEMLYSHTCTFEELCEYITEDTYELIRNNSNIDGEITEVHITNLLLRCHGCNFDTEGKFLYPKMINETISRYIEYLNKCDYSYKGDYSYQGRGSKSKYNRTYVSIADKIIHTIPLPSYKYELYRGNGDIVFSYKDTSRSYRQFPSYIFDEETINISLRINKSNIMESVMVDINYETGGK